MVKKAIILFAFLALVKAGTAQAVTNTATNSSYSKKIEVQERILTKIQQRELKLQQLRELKAQKIASIEAKLSEIKLNNVRKFYGNMSKRLWAMIDRLEKLSLKIESRIVKIEAEGTIVDDTTKADVTKANQLLTDTKALLTSSDSMLESILSANQPKEAFKILKDNVKDIKTNLVEVHRLLVHTIGDIKGLRIGNTEELTPAVTLAPTNTPTPTSTPTPTNTPTLTPTPTI